jgi:hypothetical protein
MHVERGAGPICTPRLENTGWESMTKRVLLRALWWVGVLMATGPALAGKSAADPASTPSLPVPLASRIAYVAGSSQKVCQLTGQMDHQCHTPTVNQTITRVGPVGAALGYSFEHNGKLFFLLGDAAPSPTCNGKANRRNDPPRLPDDDDTLGFTLDTSVDQCLRLDFIRNATNLAKTSFPSVRKYPTVFRTKAAS